MIVIFFVIMIVLHAFHDLLRLEVFPHGFQQIDDLHVLVDCFGQGVAHPFVRFPAHIDEYVAGGNPHDILDGGLIGMQVHAVAQQHGQLHVAAVRPDHLAGPVVEGEDGGDDADLLSFRRRGQEAGEHQHQGKHYRNDFFHVQSSWKPACSMDENAPALIKGHPLNLKTVFILCR